MDSPSSGGASSTARACVPQGRRDIPVPSKSDTGRRGGLVATANHGMRGIRGARWRRGNEERGPGGVFFCARQGLPGTKKAAKRRCICSCRVKRWSAYQIACVGRQRFTPCRFTCSPRFAALTAVLLTSSARRARTALWAPRSNRARDTPASHRAPSTGCFPRGSGRSSGGRRRRPRDG